MQKTAQKRSRLSGLRDLTHMPTNALKRFFDPEMKRIMNSLTKFDDNIRTILSGEKIGSADVVVENGQSVKSLLKNTRSKFNRREYMSAIADLGDFDKRLHDAAVLVNNFRIDVDKVHESFLFQGLEDSEKEKLRSLKEHMSNKKSNPNYNNFIKEAGLADFWHNLTTTRGRALAAWENRYPKISKDLKSEGIRLLDSAERISKALLLSLKEMDSFRSASKIDEYIKSANNIQELYNQFSAGEHGFSSYYKNIVKPWYDKFEQWEKLRASQNIPTESPTQPSESISSQQAPSGLELENDPSAPSGLELAEVKPQQPQQQSLQFGAPVAPVQPSGLQLQPVQQKPVVPTEQQLPIVNPAPTPTPTVIVPDAADTERDLSRVRKPKTRAHKAFLESLESFSNEDPLILSGYITKYAKSIQATDLESAIELFNIAKQLKQ